MPAMSTRTEAVGIATRQPEFTKLKAGLFFDVVAGPFAVVK